jgi:hypothetical protein
MESICGLEVSADGRGALGERTDAGIASWEKKNVGEISPKGVDFRSEIG